MTALVWDLKPSEKGQAEQIGRLVKRLDSDSFPEREQASKALVELGEDAAEPLRTVLEGKPSPEVRQRVEDLLDRLKRPARELELLWSRLTGGAEDADAAMRELAASPRQSAELLGRLLKPADKGQSAQIARLVKRLDSDSFPEREQASAALAELGEDAAAALGTVLDGKPSPEVRRRAEDLLDRLKARGPSPERLRGLRAVQVLEWIGTPAALRVLEAMANGAPNAERTRVAAGALARLKQR